MLTPQAVRSPTEQKLRHTRSEGPKGWQELRMLGPKTILLTPPVPFTVTLQKSRAQEPQGPDVLMFARNAWQRFGDRKNVSTERYYHYRNLVSP